MKKKLNLKLLRIKFFIKLFLLFNFLSIPYTVIAQEEKKFSNEPSIEYLNKEIENDYIIGPGDVLFIRISPTLPDLDDFYSVDGNGTIIMPNLKRIYVSELTINELTRILNEKYKSFIKEPSVNILIRNYRPIRVVIKGEVESPGVHTLLGTLNLNQKSVSFESFSSDSRLLLNELQNNNFSNPSNTNYYGEQVDNQLNLPSKIGNNNFSTDDILLNKVSPKLNFFPTIFDGIKKAGGVTFYSDLSNLKITRVNSLTNGGGRIVTQINFLDVISGKDPDKNIRIFDGDVITISRTNIPITNQISLAVLSNLNPKYIKVIISGRINNPGVYAVTKSSTLNDSLSIAGGAKILKGKINFIRFNQDGTLDKRKFSLRKNSKRGSYKNPYLKTGDIIYIGRSPLNVASEVISDITRPFIGINQFKNLFFD